MNVIVCVKQIPDPALPGELDPSTNTLKRDGKLILDESDSYGVEMALQLVDAAQFRAEAERKHARSHRFEGRRGRILDRHGYALAAPRAAGLHYR